MKLIHLADLHIGKIVNGFPMLNDQSYILTQINEHIGKEKPDAVIIAGDIYDKPTPSAEAVLLFDEFLTTLSSLTDQVLIISGNHDSAERLGFGGRLLARQHIHLSQAYRGQLTKVSTSDSYGEFNFYLMPFIKPSYVRPFFEGTAIESYDEAVNAVLSAQPIDENKRNVLIAHQFVLPGDGSIELSDSEVHMAGGLDSVASSCFAGFDYVALGHIHRAQMVGTGNIRYAGSPLKYSFSECNHQKSITKVTLLEKGQVEIETIPLNPRRDLRKIRGPLAELLKEENLAMADTEDYLQVTLTDEEEIIDPAGKLKHVYPNLMTLVFDNIRTRTGQEISEWNAVKSQTPLELFEQFYQEQNGSQISEEQKKIVKNYL